MVGSGCIGRIRISKQGRFSKYGPDLGVHDQDPGRFDQIRVLWSDPDFKICFDPDSVFKIWLDPSKSLIRFRVDFRRSKPDPFFFQDESGYNLLGSKILALKRIMKNNCISICIINTNICRPQGQLTRQSLDYDHVSTEIAFHFQRTFDLFRHLFYWRLGSVEVRNRK